MIDTSWVAPLAVSSAVALVATPAARRIALRVGMVDRPAAHKAHRRTTPYLGGLAIALAVIAGRLTHATTRVEAVVTGLAAVLAVMGLIDDDRTLPPLPRFAVEVACAAVAVAFGLRVHGSGVTALDVGLTVLILVWVTNSTNLMDNLDGLAAGTTAAGAAGTGVLAGLSGHSHVMAEAASLTGACLAFLVFNARPASIFMGDAGSLFLGFLLAGLAVRAGAPLPQPAGLVVTLLIIALPATDTVVVFFARIRHQRSPFQGGQDHLSHRLAGTGIGGGPAVSVLIGVEAGLSGLAVLVGRQVIPPWAGLAAAAAVLAAVIAVALRTKAYRSTPEPARLPMWLVLGPPAVLIVLGALALPAAFAMLRARSAALSGQATLQDAVAAAHAGDLHAVSTDLTEARRYLGQARGDLSGPLVGVGLAYPVLSTNLSAARAIVSTGLSLSEVGNQLVTADQGYHQWIRGGAVDLARISSAAPGLHDAEAVVGQSRRQVADLSRSYLVPQLASATTRLERSLATADRELDSAGQAATYLPQLLGHSGPRRYFLAVQNPTETRGTGGLIGNWGILDARQGRLRLEDFQRLGILDHAGTQNRRLTASANYLALYQRFDPAHDWQNVNMSPSFPTVGAVIAQLFPQSGGSPVDGVIVVDPAGLKALLTLTGPVNVKGWPQPLSAANVEQVTLFDAYLKYTDETARAGFLGDVAHSAFSAFTKLDVGDPSRILDALRPTVAGRHIQVYSTHSSEEAYLERAGISGELPPVLSDSVGLTVQNIAANKIDWFLHRSIDYHVRLTPSDAAGSAGPDRAAINCNLDIALHNAAPASGLPQSIIGPYLPSFQPGENASYVSIYSPLYFLRATLAGDPTSLSSGIEAHRNVYSTFVDIPAGQTASLEVQLSGTVALLPGGWYQLQLPHQPVVNPDQVTVTIDVAPGWKAVAARAATVTGPHSVTATLRQSTDQTIWVQVAPDSSRERGG